MHVAITANLLEWYDFGIYGFLALVMGQVFFPTHGPLTSLLASFSVVAVSYLVRPLGSVIFGLMGDRYGPGCALGWSTVLMALPTVLIGVLPTYRWAGWYAPLLLVGLRLIQGFAAGGEFPLSAYYVAERALLAQRGWLSSLVHVGGSCGILLASFVAFLLDTTFSQNAIREWAWRLPFLLGGPLFLMVYRIRRAIVNHAPPHGGIVLGFNASSIRAVLAGALLVAALEVGFYVMWVWFPNDAQIDLHYASTQAHLSNTLALLCYTTAILASGAAARVIPYQKILLLSLITTACAVYPLFFLLVHVHEFVVLVTVLLSLAVLYGCLGGVLLVALYAVCQRHGRCLGLSMAFTLSAALFGGSAPLVCSYVTERTHMATFPALYLALFCLLALPVAYRLCKSERSVEAAPPLWAGEPLVQADRSLRRAGPIHSRT